MAYASLDDLLKKVDEPTLIRLTDVAGTGGVDEATATRAIRDADALIDAYVATHYMVPVNPVPHVVTDLSATLAVAGLFAFRSLPSPVWEGGRERAIALLKEVAAGRATLEGAVQEPPPSSNSASTVSVTANPRLFSRDLLGGM